MTFNPTEHMTNLKGKQYLEVKWRLVWFRETHAKGRIDTDIISSDPLVIKAVIADESGMVLATGHGSAVAKPGAVWSGREIEKAETAAIGRALAHAGFGTQFNADDEDVVDSPVERAPRPTPPPKPQPTQPAKVINIPLDANGEPDLDVLLDNSPTNPPPEDRRIGTLTQKQAATLHDLGQKLGIAEPQKTVLGVEKYSLYTGTYAAAEAAIRAAAEAAKDASIQF